MTAALVALGLSGGLEFVRWGQGRLNWGPRLGAVLLVLAGQVLVMATPAAGYLRLGVDFLAGWANRITAYALGAAGGNAVDRIVHWLPAFLVGAFWVAAFFPGRFFGERMTWRLAWAGFLLPAFLGAIPGVGGDFLGWLFGLVASAGAAIVNGLFHLAG